MQIVTPIRTYTVRYSSKVQKYFRYSSYLKNYFVKYNRMVHLHLISYLKWIICIFIVKLSFKYAVLHIFENIMHLFMIQLNF